VRAVYPHAGDHARRNPQPAAGADHQLPGNGAAVS
jgi:hypothetical protein